MVFVSVENNGACRRLTGWRAAQFICNSHTTTMCADPIGSGNMLTPSKKSGNRVDVKVARRKKAVQDACANTCRLEEHVTDTNTTSSWDEQQLTAHDHPNPTS